MLAAVILLVRIMSCYFTSSQRWLTSEYVFMQLLGARDEDIIADYSLTTVGLQPFLPLLVARFQKEDVYRDNWQGTLNVATARCVNVLPLLHLVAFVLRTEIWVRVVAGRSQWRQSSRRFGASTETSKGICASTPA